ncbi:predicted protein [Sparassis crispa]|uniref:Uncharacterized protein n=1 Tax=Sparassis crispa TaxID=139825 RepID=A0A401GX29_9APHY|nr:predicted protein [Sparassis crispa]GBE86740.1 predicted protein [Sparassis crispa]
MRRQCAVPPDGYDSPLGKKRGELRRLIAEGLRRVTGVPHAEMFWTAREFYRFVAVRHSVLLDGWPDDVLFANLSTVRGGIRTLDRLLDLWNEGTLCFRRISDSEVLALNEASAAPGRYVERPRRTAGRPDIKKHRRRPITNPLGLPRAKEKRGPKSPEFVVDSDDEPGVTVETQPVQEERVRKRRKRKLREPKSKEFIESDMDT